MRACGFAVLNRVVPSELVNPQAMLQCNRQRSKAFRLISMEANRRFGEWVPSSAFTGFKGLDSIFIQHSDFVGYTLVNSPYPLRGERWAS